MIAFPKGNYLPKKTKSGATTALKILVQQCDTLFSEYIRRRDSDDYGFVTCATCDEHLHWSASECGHYIVRSKVIVRYDEHNASAQCFSCNRTSDGMHDSHRLTMVERWGMFEVKRIEGIAKSAYFKYSRDWLKDIKSDLLLKVKSERNRIGDASY